jgi:hypothetical protein
MSMYGMAAKGTLSDALQRVEFMQSKVDVRRKEKPTGWSAAVGPDWRPSLLSPIPTRYPSSASSIAIACDP